MGIVVESVEKSFASESDKIHANLTQGAQAMLDSQDTLQTVTRRLGTSEQRIPA